MLAENIATYATMVPPRGISPSELREYQTEGFVVLRGLVPPEHAEHLRQEVMATMETIGLGQSKLRQTGQYVGGGCVDAFVNSPNLRAVAEQLTEGPSTLYMPFTAVKSAARPGSDVGGGVFHFHQDNQYTRFDGPGINLWLALSPMSEANGCLRCVPKSHLQGTLPSFSPDGDVHKAVTFEPDDFVAITAEPGDCVAFSRLTVHGSGPNMTAEHRVAYAVQFHRNDVNLSTDQGETWRRAIDHPLWPTGPVDQIRPRTDPATRDGH